VVLAASETVPLPLRRLLMFQVAESGLGPFGEDDDDFDINLLVDRYLHVCICSSVLI